MVSAPVDWTWYNNNRNKYSLLSKHAFCIDKLTTQTARDEWPIIQPLGFILLRFSENELPGDAENKRVRKQCIISHFATQPNSHMFISTLCGEKI